MPWITQDHAKRGSATERRSLSLEATEVVVIGAGPSGLAVGACLQKRRIDFIILEKDHQVGSSWRRHYERLHLHTIKSRSSLPFRSFDRNYPRYVPKALVIRYLEEYAASFDLKPHFGENVHAVRRQGNEWLIESTSKALRAPNLVVASGLNAQPLTPNFPGAEKFRGRILHGGAYINATPFAGQRVLVVGMGNTGAEIALDLCEHGAQTTISIRSGVHIVPRDLFGLPIQVVATVATCLLPLKINDALFPIILDFALGNLSKHGIKRPRQGILEQVVTSGKIPVLDVGTAKLIRDRRINVMRGLAEILENGAIFADGEERRFDAIIFATGYRPGYQNFLHLDDSLGASSQGVGPPIYFVGFRNPVTGLLREISKEAQSVANAIARGPT
jgi:cation diffusion facilitator CzcD-associated flavoprotein CzcO